MNSNYYSLNINYFKIEIFEINDLKLNYLKSLI